MHASSLTQQRFGRHFGTYDQQAVVQRLMAHRLVAGVVPYMSCAPRNVFEIGCGTGLVTKALDGDIAIARYCGNDLVAESETQVRTILSTLADEDFSFINGNAAQIQTLPFSPDLIISGASFQWIADLPVFLNNLHELLSESGILAFSSFGPGNYAEIRQLTGFGLAYHSLEQLKEMLGEQFDILSAEESIDQLWFSTPADVLRHIRETGVNGISEVRWTRSRLNVFASEYLDLFKTDRGVSLTYHPLQIIAKKI